MSKFSSNRMVVEARPSNQELIAGILRDRLGSPSGWVASSQLAQLQNSLAAASDTGEALALLDATTLKLAFTGQELILHDTRGRLHALPGPGLALTQSALRPLESALNGIVAVNATAERIAVTELASGALRSIGFDVRSGDGTDTSGIEARRDHSVIAIAVTDGGAMDIDTMGHGGDECEAVLAEMTDAFRAVGLSVSTRRTERHGNPEGGSLITAAIAASPTGDLLTGLIGEGEPTVQARPAKASAAVRHRQGARG